MHLDLFLAFRTLCMIFATSSYESRGLFYGDGDDRLVRRPGLFLFLLLKRTRLAVWKNKVGFD